MIASGAMMPSSLSLLFYQCAVIVVSFEGIVCPLLDFVIDNFGTVDIYDNVALEGPLNSGSLILKKATTENPRQRALPIVDILRYTMKIEGNNPQVVSFSLRGESHSNYNLKFTSEGQARHFYKFKAIPVNHKIEFVRIYANYRPIIMAYENFDNGDMGFKFLDNANFAEFYDHLERLPFIFRRSEIENAIRTAHPQTLYLRNKRRAKDYQLMFRSTDDLGVFLKLFPRRRYNDSETKDYFIMSTSSSTQTQSHEEYRVVPPTSGGQTHPSIVRL